MEVVEQSGVIKFWVTELFRQADVNSVVSLDDRMMSCVLLTEVWLHKPNFIDPLTRQSPETLIEILKKGARDF